MISNARALPQVRQQLQHALQYLAAKEVRAGPDEAARTQKLRWAPAVMSALVRHRRHHPSRRMVDPAACLAVV